MSEPVIVIGTIPIEDYSKGWIEEINISNFFLSIKDLKDFLQSLDIDSPQELDTLLTKHCGGRYKTAKDEET